MIDFFHHFYISLVKYWYAGPLIVFFTAPLIIGVSYLNKDIDLTRPQWIKLYWSEVCAQLSGAIVILGLSVFIR